MTGIVVVSHSHALATAAVALAREMAADARIEIAAGLDETTFGTDAAQIAHAVESADDGAGVVVLMDLGSAVLAAETALELLDPDLAGRVVLSPGPLVEGLVVGAVGAAGGATAERVAAEAAAGLVAKEQHLGGAAPSAAGATTEGPAAPGDRATARFTVATPTGIHARPAARLVETAARLSEAGADVQLRNLTTGSGPVAGDSMLEVMTLGAELGHEVEVTGAGPDGQRAVEEIVALAERNFDE